MHRRHAPRMAPEIALLLFFSFFCLVLVLGTRPGHATVNRSSWPHHRLLFQPSVHTDSDTDKSVDILKGHHPSLALTANLQVGSSCTDGLRNGDELGVDCGGSCVRCLVLCQLDFCCEESTASVGNTCTDHGDGTYSCSCNSAAGWSVGGTPDSPTCTPPAMIVSPVFNHRRRFVMLKHTHTQIIDSGRHACLSFWFVRQFLCYFVLFTPKTVGRFAVSLWPSQVPFP